MDAAGPDPFNLERFVLAQNFGGTYAVALAEVQAGRKTSHWMWFVFPQVDGLGHSWMARKYSIETLEEARAYLAHPVLGPRIVEISAAALQLAEAGQAQAGQAQAGQAPRADDTFGAIDALKLRSSMTLFAIASEGAAGGPRSAGAEASTIFDRVIGVYFGGKPDAATEHRLQRVSLG